MKKKRIGRRICTWKQLVKRFGVRKAAKKWRRGKRVGKWTPAAQRRIIKRRKTRGKRRNPKRRKARSRVRRRRRNAKILRGRFEPESTLVGGEGEIVRGEFGPEARLRRGIGKGLGRGTSKELYELVASTKGGAGGRRAFRPERRGAPKPKRKGPRRTIDQLFLEATVAKLGLKQVGRDRFETTDGVEVTGEELLGLF